MSDQIPENLKDAAYVLERGTDLDALMEHGKFWLASELLSAKQEINTLLHFLATAEQRIEEIENAVSKITGVEHEHDVLLDLEVTADKLSGKTVSQVVHSLATAERELAELRREVDILRLYGNKDCTAMADEELARIHNPSRGES